VYIIAATTIITMTMIINDIIYNDVINMDVLPCGSFTDDIHSFCIFYNSCKIKFRLQNVQM